VEDGAVNRRHSMAGSMALAAMAAAVIAAAPALAQMTPRPAAEAWAEARRFADQERFAQALDVIARALRDHPGDTGLLWLRAGVTGWAGRHDESVELYEQLVTRHPHLAEDVRVDLATQRLWSGDAAGALRDLDIHLAHQPADREARRLRDQARMHSGPAAAVSYERSDDSDGQRILSSVLEISQPLGPRDILLFDLRQDQSSDPGGAREAFRLGAGHERRWSDRWSSRLAVQHLNPGPGSPKAVVGEAAVVVRPDPRIRVDLGIELDPILTRLALDADVIVWTAVAGFDWQPAARLGIHLSRRQHDYSDDNEAFRNTARIHVPVLRGDHLRLTAAFHVEQLKIAKDLDHGYYDPDRYVEYGPGIELEWQPAEPWMVGMDIRAGRQSENDLDHDPFASINGNAQVPLGRLLALRVHGFHSDSNLRSISGFEGSGWSVGLSTRF
jgi:hypothetical protein